MPSTRSLAVALTAMVLLAGCSMVPGLGGGDGGGSAPDAPQRHDVVVVSDTGGEPYDGTVTISKNGEMLVTESLSMDGNGSYANLTSLTEPGPYTITVNTSLPAAGGDNLFREFEVDNPLGNATVLDVTYPDVTYRSAPLPYREMQQPVYFSKIALPVETEFVITHEGEVVYENTSHREGEGPFELTTLPETGAYRVHVSTSEHTTTKAVVLKHPESKLVVELRGTDPIVEVLPPEMPEPQ
jgi:hypothetical protein